MKRTQIYMTPQQHKLLQQKAHEEGTSVSHIIRKAIEKEVEKKEQKKKKVNPGKWLLEMAEEAERRGFHGPPDLATNMDEYLYGDKK